MLKRYQVYRTTNGGTDGRIVEFIGHVDAEDGREALKTVLEGKHGMFISEWLNGNRCRAILRFSSLTESYRAMAVR